MPALLPLPTAFGQRPPFETEHPPIVVVGSTNTDLVVDVPHIPAPGETILGGDLLTVAGGKGANQAVACARLGANVTFIARIGDDAFGKAALDNLKREGINCDYVRVTDGVASGVALISVAQASAENAIVVAPGANAHLTAGDVSAAAEAFDNAQVIVVSQEVPFEAVAQAVRMGRERGIPTILNPAPAQPTTALLFDQLSVLTPNETEALQLAALSPNDDPERAVEILREKGVSHVVLTRGARGAQVCDSGGTTDIAPYPVQAIDTVAAGDCFTGALAVEIARGADTTNAARFACAAAALKVTRRGAQPGIPTRAEVEAFRQSTP